MILLSDGEKTSGLDPCAVGAALRAQGVDFTAHVIGFDIADPRHREQPACLARAAGGRYVDACDAAGLRKALGEAQQASVEAKLPPAEATLSPPPTATAASMLAIGWSEQPGEGDCITVVAPAAGPLAYLDFDQRLRAGQPARLRVPAEPGEYELRYVSPRRAEPLLARAPISVTPASAMVSVAAEVIASVLVDITPHGRTDGNHWIGFAPAASGVGSYPEFLRPDGSASTQGELIAPQQPGR